MTFLASQSLEACDHLEALGELSTAVHRLNEVIEQMNQKIVELDPHFRAVESKISSMHVPFQMSVFEFMQANQKIEHFDAFEEQSEAVPRFYKR
mmetsp:Transcript_4815/g.5570  ORF Transcript_4815/g.5570 Transcript_4815/m.5570 type:complete len:94 (-) Transcript_4815:529-810(-)